MNDYDRDFYAWTQTQSTHLRRHDTQHLDWENLAEEIEAIGRQERQELINRLRVLLGHLLKWHYQPQNRSHSWEATIALQRDDIADLLRDNPSLKPFLTEAFADSYKKGRLLAIAETNLPAKTFPIEPPFDLDYALTADLDQP